MGMKALCDMSLRVTGQLAPEESEPVSVFFTRVGLTRLQAHGGIHGGHLSLVSTFRETDWLQGGLESYLRGEMMVVAFETIDYAPAQQQHQ